MPRGYTVWQRICMEPLVRCFCSCGRKQEMKQAAGMARPVAVLTCSAGGQLKPCFAGVGPEQATDAAEPHQDVERPWTIEDCMNKEFTVTPAYLMSIFAVKDCVLDGNHLQGIVRKGTTAQYRRYCK